MKRALTIGINDYGDPSINLQGCVNDAKDWASALRLRGYETSSMLDREASSSAMRQRMRTLVAEAQYGDTIVITYSGHGTWLPDVNGDEPDERDEALCPQDIAVGGPLTDDDLYDIFARRGRGVRLVFISDSCHSGSVNRFAGLLDAHAAERRVRFLAPEIYLPEKYLQAARAVSARPPRTLPLRSSALLMAGCRDYEFSYDAQIDKRFNGAFTHVALKVLAALPREATYTDWIKEIRRYLPSMSFPQTPVLAGTYSQRTWSVL